MLAPPVWCHLFPRQLLFQVLPFLWFYLSLHMCTYKLKSMSHTQEHCYVTIQLWWEFISHTAMWLLSSDLQIHETYLPIKYYKQYNLLISDKLMNFLVLFPPVYFIVGVLIFQMSIIIESGFMCVLGFSTIITLLSRKKVSNGEISSIPLSHINLLLLPISKNK